MKRRELIILLGGAALRWPCAARAQQSAVPRVGYVWAGVHGTEGSGTRGLRRGLADLGYVVGRNLVLEERYANGDPERVASLIDELLALNVNVLVTPGTPITLAAHRATSTVPIVSVTGDPVRTGLAESLARPGGNITGLSLLSGDYSVKWLELLREAVPAARRIALLWNPDNSATFNQSKLILEQAPGLGFELTPLSMRQVDVEDSLAAIVKAGLDGFVATDDPVLETYLARLIALAAERRLPAIYAYDDAANRGGLMSYSANFFKLFQRAAGYVDRIIKGARPAELPIEQATEVTLKINLKTAKALGLVIPEALLARANELIE